MATCNTLAIAVAMTLVPLTDELIELGVEKKLATRSATGLLVIAGAAGFNRSALIVSSLLHWRQKIKTIKKIR